MPACASCGRESPDDARFCAGCGAAFPSDAPVPANTRKVKRATVMALDPLSPGEAEVLLERLLHGVDLTADERAQLRR